MNKTLPKPGELSKLKKQMKKLEKKFEKAKGMPLRLARITKTALKVQNRIDFITE